MGAENGLILNIKSTREYGKSTSRLLCADSCLHVFPKLKQLSVNLFLLSKTPTQRSPFSLPPLKQTDLAGASPSPRVFHIQSHILT